MIIKYSVLLRICSYLAHLNTHVTTQLKLARLFICTEAIVKIKKHLMRKDIVIFQHPCSVSCIIDLSI